MKKVLMLLVAAAFIVAGAKSAMAQGMAVNTSGAAADASAMLDVSSTSQGMLIPRMLNSQLTAITTAHPTAPAGLLVYQTDGTPGFMFWNGSSWVSLNSATTTAGGDLSGTYPSPVVANNAITSAKILDGTIVNSDISASAGIAYSKLSGTPASLPPNGTAGGDLTGTYPNPTLATSGVASGTYGNASSIPQVTVDTKGRITTITTVAAATSGGGSSGAIQFYGGTTTAGAIGGGTSHYKIDWNSSTVNLGSQMASGTFTVAADGYYLISAAAQISGTSGNAAFMILKIDGAIYAYGGSATNTAAFPNVGQSSISQLVKLNANQTIEMWIATAGANTLIPASTHLAIYKM